LVGRESGEEVGNVGSENESVCSKCKTEGGNCEDIPAEADEKMMKRVRLMKVNKGY
jgi:hypothetical protein